MSSTAPSAVPPPARLGVPSLRLAFASDERLARLLADGDASAFRLLYERYHQPLYRYCRSLLRNEADAQDALQSALTSAFSALSRGQRDAPIRPWLFRIAHNESVSLLRRRRPEPSLADVAESATVTLEERVEERGRLEELVADLRELPERQRGALVMRELSGLSHAEIALALNTSINAAKQTIFEARRSLTEFAEGRAMACEDVRRMISDADGRTLRSRRVRAHVRQCSGCATFAAAIPERTAQLRALAPPLPVLAAGGILARVLGGGSAHGGDGVGYLAAGAGKTVGTAVATKVAAVAAATTAAVTATVALKQPMPTVHRTTAGTAVGHLHNGASGAHPSGGSSAAAPSARAGGSGSASAARKHSRAAARGSQAGSRHAKNGGAGVRQVAAAGRAAAKTTAATSLTPLGVHAKRGHAIGTGKSGTHGSHAGTRGAAVSGSHVSGSGSHGSASHSSTHKSGTPRGHNSGTPRVASGNRRGGVRAHGQLAGTAASKHPKPARRASAPARASTNTATTTSAVPSVVSPGHGR